MFDFIIIGQGLAGSVLAISLIKEGFSVAVIDKPELSSCSKVAAGIWNPIVFKRLTRSWLADKLVPELLSFYGYAEKELGAALIHNRNIIKPFTEEQEKAFWLKKSTTESFLDPEIYADLDVNNTLHIPSYSKVLQAGNLDVRLFLEETRMYLKKRSAYYEDEFHSDQLTVTDQQVVYKTLSARNIIYCEGHYLQKNPLFSWIPMKPAKGETLTIECKDLLLENDILNKGIFMLPLGNDTFKIGATYEWEALNDLPTEARKKELVQKLTDIIGPSFTIINHEAGIRPSVIDRRPVVGGHPEYKNHFIFNGFGTKAVMLAPYFAKEFVGAFKGICSISADVDPTRFYLPKL